MLEHLRRERDDLHVALLAQLTRDRSENAGGPGLPGVVDQHSGVLVEPDVGAVLATDFLGRAHDDRLGDVTLLHLPGRDRVLDGHHDQIAQSGVTPLAATQDADDQRPAGSRVVGDAEDGFLLNHGVLYLARWTISTTRHRT